MGAINMDLSHPGLLLRASTRGRRIYHLDEHALQRYLYASICSNYFIPYRLNWNLVWNQRVFHYHSLTLLSLTLRPYRCHSPGKFSNWYI
jgi:hypothetical protein